MLLVQTNVSKAQDYQKQWYDRKARQRQFQAGRRLCSHSVAINYLNVHYPMAGAISGDKTCWKGELFSRYGSPEEAESYFSCYESGKFPRATASSCRMWQQMSQMMIGNLKLLDS